MPRRIWIVVLANLVAILGLVYSSYGQQGEPAPGTKAAKGEKKGPPRPPLFFREEWKMGAGAGEHAVMGDAVSNSNLELKLYGPGGKLIQETGTAGDESNPVHLWTGLCEGTCAAALRDKENFVDLTGMAKIRWNIKISGLHQVHPIVKLADGTWLVGDHADGTPLDWHWGDFSVAEVRWQRLDIEKIVGKGNFLDKPDLTKVDEVGFSDLMPGSGHGPGGWSDVAQIEVYGKPVKR